MPNFDFVIHGRTYAARKESVREKAMMFQDLFSEGEALSWDDLAEFGAYFVKQAKAYGLTEEFVENGIL